MSLVNSTTPLSGQLSMPPQIHLDNSLGAAFIGLIIAAMFYGITNIQTLYYYQCSGSDPLFLKHMVGILWALDTLHIIFISDAIYTVVVTNFANLLAITDTTWSLCAHIIVTSISDTMVRVFYTRRVFMISKGSYMLAIGSASFTLLTFVSGMLFAVKSFSQPSVLDFGMTELATILYISLASAVVADLWIALALCWYLMRSRTGFKTTDSKINVIMVYVINTGLLTTICALCCLISFAAMPHNFIFIAFYFSLSKLYINSLLATLNARERLREGLGPGGAFSLSHHSDIQALSSHHHHTVHASEAERERGLKSRGITTGSESYELAQAMPMSPRSKTSMSRSSSTNAYGFGTGTGINLGFKRASDSITTVTSTLIGAPMQAIRQ
ncbi:hypothetical protein SCHPADRAFT_643465 [Schizopora paradoxa]|uniref:DUF6534 domain-containing protein n=1 Tax=Schizopora paradoxa TaxID=27342 RepID=A0A0H2RDH2_9AGAM|nr:hypothetical protein SCHPADRAFT_643465 [Schizopora paradoxa]